MSKPVGKLWKRLREATLGMSEQDREPYFKKLCGVSQPTISRWRTGQAKLSQDHADLISDDTGYCSQYLRLANGPRRWDLQRPEIDKLIAVLGSWESADIEDVLRYARFAASRSQR